MSARNVKLWVKATAGVAIAALTFAAGWSASTAKKEPEVSLERFLAAIQSLPESGRVCVLPVGEKELEQIGEVCGLYAHEADVEVVVGERVLVEWIQWKGSEDESAFDVLHLTAP